MTNIFRQTDIDWMEKIPNNWKEISLRGVFEDVKEQNSDGRITNSLSLMKDVGIIPYEEKGSVGNKKSDNIEKYKIVSKGDLVINKMNAVIGSLGVSKYEGLVSPVYFVLRINESNKFLMKYFEYIFQTREVQKYFRTMATGIMEIREALDWNKFKNMLLPLPDINNQIKIVNHLDDLDAKLAMYIKKKEKSIDLLIENKLTMINELVTKGLDRNVQMKDSGIEWLGKIPKHWEVKRLKHLGEPIGGLTYSPSDVVTDQKSGTLVLRSSNIQNGELSLEDNVYVNTEIREKLKVREGDILICSRNGSRDLIGKNICIDQRTSGSTFGAFMMIFRTKQWKFVSAFLNSQVFKSQSGLFSTSTINQLTVDMLKNIYIAFPTSVREQENIYEKSVEISNDIKKIIDKANMQIDLIKQYRQSLIYEFASGKRIVN